MNTPNQIEYCSQLFDLYYPFLIIIMIVVWNVKLYYFIFLFVYRRQERGTPYIQQYSCKGLFLPSFVKIYFFCRRTARAIIDSILISLIIDLFQVQIPYEISIVLFVNVSLFISRFVCGKVKPLRQPKVQEEWVRLGLFFPFNLCFKVCSFNGLVLWVSIY